MAQKSFYPHMVVGNIVKVPTDIVENYLVTYDVTPSDLVTDLNDAVTNEEPLTEFETIAQEYLDTNADAISEKADLLALFPEFDTLVEMLSTSDHTTIQAPGDFTFGSVAHESKFWDNAIAHFIQNKINPLTNDLILATRLIGLLKKIQDTTLNTKLKILNFWKKSHLVFPKPIFPLPKKIVEEPAPPIDTPDSTYEALLAELNKFQSAREEIMDAYEFQIQKLKKVRLTEEQFKNSLKYPLDEDKQKGNNVRNNIEIDPEESYQSYLDVGFAEELTEEYFTALSTATKNVLKVDLRIPGEEINVLFATKKIDGRIGKVAAALMQFSKPQHVVIIGNTLIAVNNAVYEDVICSPTGAVTHCELLHQLIAENPKKTYVQVLGTGYANIIRQELVRYEADEIAHIENVLAKETKEKTHRNLKTREETLFTESERNEETETNTKTSDRFELSKEINTLVSQSTQFDAGVSLSASYGPVSLTANVGYATASSASEATSTAVNNAKEITQEATSRIQERILERRSITTINEVEVTNLHKIDNSQSTEHINGFYYWVDKVYTNQVYNLGKRLMLEFLIPEPAAYHIYSNAFSKKEGVTIEKPIDPREYTDGVITASLKSHKDINRTNYHLWAALYKAQDIPAPPQEFTTTSKAYSLDYTPGGKEWYDKDFNDLTVPDGYQADTAFLGIAFSYGSGRYIGGNIGRKPFSVGAPSNISIALDGETGFVPFSFRGHFEEYAINVEVLCKLSTSGYEKWQLAAYNSIINAYNQQKAEYDNQVAGAEAGITISGQNPIENRKTEQTELKKWALELLTLQRFDGFNSMQRASNGNPEMDFNEALNEGIFVKFFEQSIEWYNMTYLFYPYFWGRKERWTTIKQLGDTDQVFSEFLKAGYARVVVPVHPKFTEAMLHYLNTGEIWMGEELPAIDDELYLSIVEEIQAQENNVDGEPIGAAWETRIPTNMVMLTGVIPEDLPGS
ncbi:MAG: hypothetical protein IPM74_03550 [Crocinitomicaceae bacterium]|nr:hypothetical protein [Crocinitomicaceae bacterium]MBK8924988.1 hypothetical protein [Crocinitomicaceae bacterium]